MIPKLTETQRHILELLDKGWQIGAGHERTWLQKGGAGHGGETEKLKFDDLLALLNQRLVYQSKKSFPTSTYDITEAGSAFLQGNWTDEIHERVKALLDDKGALLQPVEEAAGLPPAEHPSYGQVSIHHTTGGPGELYGASVRHDSRISLRIAHSTICRGTGHEFHHAGKSIVEVDLSYDQFVSMLFSSNRGDGVPCTIRQLSGKSIEGPTLTNKRSQISKEFANTVQAVTANAVSLKAEAERILKTPGGLKATDKAYLLEILQKLTQDVSENIPYIERRFQEQIDKSVTEVEVQLAQKAASLGILSDNQTRIEFTPKLPAP